MDDPLSSRERRTYQKHSPNYCKLRISKIKIESKKPPILRDQETLRENCIDIQYQTTIYQFMKRLKHYHREHVTYQVSHTCRQEEKEVSNFQNKDDKFLKLLRKLF